MTEHLGTPERRRFLEDRRKSSQRRYDADLAPGYDTAEWGKTSLTHARYLQRFLELVRPGGLILDMPCGTGKYFATVEATGRSVVGFDQSAGMLKVGRAKHPHVPTARLALQELSIDHAFDGVMCMDSMENVGPEDWPSVLTALRHAARPGAALYLTVEMADEADLAAYYQRARAAGYPVTPRESFDHERGGYHHFPERQTVLARLAEAGLVIVEDGEGDWYLHLLLQTRE